MDILSGLVEGMARLVVVKPTDDSFFELCWRLTNPPGMVGAGYNPKLANGRCGAMQCFGMAGRILRRAVDLHNS